MHWTQHLMFARRAAHTALRRIASAIREPRFADMFIRQAAHWAYDAMCDCRNAAVAAWRGDWSTQMHRAARRARRLSVSHL